MSWFFGDKKKTQVNKQAQTVDQNYANNILFMALSALQTLESKIRNRVEGRGNGYNLRSNEKEFGNYDKHDYSYKEEIEVKGQLMNNVMLLAQSKMAFELTYGKGSYELPQNYNEKMVVNRLGLFKQTFQQLKDQDCYYLADDIERIISRNQTNGLHYETMKIVDPYEGKTTNKQFLNGAVRASESMREEEERIKQKLGNNMDPKNL